MANKITGATRLTTQDIKNIETLANAGLKVAQITEITGWSTPVVSRIKNGVYAEVNKQKREYERAKRQGTLPVETPSKDETVQDETIVEDFDTVSLKKVLMELNKQLAFIIINMKGRV